jgi:hypothetical protein
MHSGERGSSVSSLSSELDRLKRSSFHLLRQPIIEKAIASGNAILLDYKIIRYPIRPQEDLP